VANDQRIDFADVDFHQCEVVRVDFRREAEVGQVLARLVSSARRQMQGEPPLA
jgi:hypothetical protein